MTSHTAPPTAGRPRAPWPRASAAGVMSANTTRIARIQLCFGIDAVTFDEQVLSVVRRLADYVVNLPASKDGHYGHPGGMFELALDTAFFSLQGTDGHIFAGGSTISVRRHLEPRWRLATFIAGLLCILERAAGQVIVEDASGSRWPALLQTLGAWLAQRPDTTVHLTWRADLQDVPGYGLLALSQVVPTPILQYLSDGNDEVLPSLLACIGGLPRYRDHSPLPRLVRRAFALVVNQWLETSGAGDGPPQDPAHHQRYVLDAMRRLAACHPRWVPNREKSRLWLGEDGLYLVWPQSAIDILGSFEEDELAGMPRSAANILPLLQSAGVLEPNPAAGDVWEVHPPSASGPVQAIKLTSPSVLYPTAPADGLTALSMTLAAARVDHAAPRPRPAPPPVAPPAGEQLSLALPVQEATANAGANGTSGEPMLQRGDGHAIGLRPPLRLDRAVQAALQVVIHRLNTTGRGAQVSAQGLFVPMAAFDRNRLEAPLAVRAMDKTQMLLRDAQGSPETCHRDIDGEDRLGVVIRPEFLDGFQRSPAAHG